MTKTLQKILNEITAEHLQATLSKYGHSASHGVYNVQSYTVTIPSGTYTMKSNLSKSDLTNPQLFPSPADTYRFIEQFGVKE